MLKAVNTRVFGKSGVCVFKPSPTLPPLSRNGVRAVLQTHVPHTFGGYRGNKRVNTLFGATLPLFIGSYCRYYSSWVRVEKRYNILSTMFKVGRYDILREIGRSVDVVYEGVDKQLGRRVAIKELLSADDPAHLRQRFLHEAQAVARLNHPCIVVLYDALEEQGRYFLFMELVEGETLRQMLRRRQRLPASEAIELTRHILEGLNHAHQHGVIHRDIKPENIFILPSGGVKIADFGIALLKGLPRQTLTGQIKGTPSYLAPEQIDNSTITEATDLFAVGIILFEMVEGYRPFAGNNLVQVLSAILKNPVPPMQHAPPPLQQVIKKALEKNPAQRYSTAKEFLRALSRASAMPPAPPTTAPTPAPAPPAPATGQSIQQVAGDPERLIAYVEQNLAGFVAVSKTLPSGAARYAPIPPWLDQRLQEWLHRHGITTLYEHQLLALEQARKGLHLGIVAGTASGKTLSFNLPVLHTLLEQPNATALYVYPTKALTQDQLKKLREFELEQVIPMRIYDGDTPKDERPKIRQIGRLVLTNPDMLHYAILPYHRSWARFLQNLKFVVIDEMHVYRGVFGAHMAGILRRLLRIAQIYHAKPQFFFASATVENAGDLAYALIGQPVQIIQTNSAPRPERKLIMWRRELGGGWWDSANQQTAELIVLLMQAGVRHIAFVRSRLSAEVIHQKVLETLKRSSLPHLMGKVETYRSGYLPHERREIERKLSNGDLLSVISTNALELGIDIGHLDAVILNGYPGSLASFWQQAGRAGRRGRPTPIFFVLHQDPLHAYLSEHPEHLTDTPVERATINWQNASILASHLSCGAYEAQLDAQSLDFFRPCSQLDELLQQLEQNGVLLRNANHWRYLPPEPPHSKVSIRSVSNGAFTVRRQDNLDTIAEVDIKHAYAALYPGAIYLHNKDVFYVKTIDYDTRVAWVVPTEPGEYTEPIMDISVRVIQTTESQPFGKGELRRGILIVREQVVGYKRKIVLTDETVEKVSLTMPAFEFITTGIWWLVKEDALVDRLPVSVYPGMHAIEHTARSLMSIFTGCDSADIGSVTQVGVPEAGKVAFFLYDDYEGGLGICESMFPRFRELMEAAKSRIVQCTCREGCPRCILLSACHQQNQDLDKEAAVKILKTLILSG